MPKGVINDRGEKYYMIIDYLCDHIGYVDTVARWIYDEFVSGIISGHSYEDVLASVKRCNKQELPIRLVALAEENCVGTVSIVINDLKCRDYTPWLAALYVDKEFRNQKIGERLIDAVKDICVASGYNEVYLRTEHASDYYRRLGWQYVETCEDIDDLIPDVFLYELDTLES